MGTASPRKIVIAVLIMVQISLAAACGSPRPAPTGTTPPLATMTTTASPLPPTATPTPEPLAATVNGEAITLAEFQAELARYKAALITTTPVPAASSAGATETPESTPAPGTNLATDEKQLVLDDMINQVLLEQGAAQEGYKVDAAAVQARLDQLAVQAGGVQVLTAWETAQGYSDQSFRLVLAKAMAAAWMRDKIAASVPQAIEQVHARQILLYNEAEANQILSQIESGSDFATLAEDYDPVTGGDLGWFPRGYLTEPELEQAAFSLQPGEHSGVIHTRLGYHILEVIERDPQHPLDPEARLVLQSQAVRQWLDQRRKQSEIKIMALQN